MFDCKHKGKGKGTNYGTSTGGPRQARDDEPDYSRPIYDGNGNRIGVIYDYPPAPGPSGLS